MITWHLSFTAIDFLYPLWEQTSVNLCFQHDLLLQNRILSYKQYKMRLSKSPCNRNTNHDKKTELSMPNTTTPPNSLQWHCTLKNLNNPICLEFDFVFIQKTDEKPWWKANFFISEPVLFGAWDGVFTSCMLNIFGVIIFLRTGWMVVREHWFLFYCFNSLDILA